MLTSALVHVHVSDLFPMLLSSHRYLGTQSSKRRLKTSQTEWQIEPTRRKKDTVKDEEGGKAKEKAEEADLPPFMRGLKGSVEGLEGVSFSETHTPVQSDEEDARLAAQFIHSSQHDWPSVTREEVVKGNEKLTAAAKKQTLNKSKTQKAGKEQKRKVEELTRKGFRFDADGNIYHGNALIPPQYRALVLDPAVIRTKRDRILERKAKTLEKKSGEQPKQGRFTLQKEKRKSRYRVDYGEHLTRRQLRVARLVDDGLDEYFGLDKNDFLSRAGFAVEHVDITRDMRIATVHWSCSSHKEKVEKVLSNRNAQIRAGLVTQIRMKFAPELVFKPASGSTLEQDIERLLEISKQELQEKEEVRGVGKVPS